MVNVKLLKKVRKLIAEEPRRLNMNKWGRKWSPESIAINSNLPPCGTTACLAGWIVFAGRPKLLKEMAVGALESHLWISEHKDVDYEAAALVGLDAKDCPFYQTSWGTPDVLAWIDRQIDAASK